MSIEKACTTCEHRAKLRDEAPCATCDGESAWVRLPTAPAPDDRPARMFHRLKATNPKDTNPKDTNPKDTNPKDAIAIDKLPMHLVSPIIKAYQAIAHYLGNVKYGAWNYRAAGVRNSIYKSALERHVDAWWEGEDYDPTDGTPHLANAQACLNILIEGQYTPGTVDDRPPSRRKELAAVRAEFEALMPKLREKYADKSPRHYTIADSK